MYLGSSLWKKVSAMTLVLSLVLLIKVLDDNMETGMLNDKIRIKKQIQVGTILRLTSVSLLDPLQTQLSWNHIKFLLFLSI